MTATAAPLPARRAGLVIRPLGNNGEFVVKDRDSTEFFHLGEEESFLLEQLDGVRSTDEICAAFEQRFHQSLSEDELREFIDTAHSQCLLQESRFPIAPVSASSPQFDEPVPAEPQPGSPAKAKLQSILNWRKSLIDPDRLFTWLEPRIRFFWTRGFLIFSAGSILAAMLMLATNRAAMAETFAYSLRWETLLLVWLVLFAITTLHEFAHGLTCKHYGGEVHEIGVLMMFFMPCFYCNVSDAWLFREKSKRLWVTLAGGYFELFLWALAVFVWRLTLPGSVPHYLAFLVVSGSGVKTLFNFNPLLKLDGYYLLSDWTETPNLRQRGTDYFLQHLRWWSWGASRPEPEARGRFLLAYGLACWVYSLLFLGLMLVGMFHYAVRHLGPWGVALVAAFAFVTGRGLARDLFAREFRTMIQQRHKRTLFWLTTIGAVGAASVIIPWPDHAGGAFEVRARRRAEVRAPVAGFLEAVYGDEGTSLSAGDVVARLKIPDLASRTAQKESGLREAEARLRLLRAGSSPAEIAQQRQRVAAMQTWRDAARQDLKRQQEVLDQDLVRLDKTLVEYKAVCDFTQQVLAKHEQLKRTNVVSEVELLDMRKNHLVACAHYEKTVAERGARAALGAHVAEIQLAEREKDLTLEQAHLALLEAKPRPEEIEAAEATVARLQEELDYLQQQASRLALTSPIAGSLTTAWPKEKIGHYFAEGELICEVEDARSLEVVIAIAEDDAARLRPGQQVRLKARALPFDVFEVKVVRVAPKAVQGDAARSKVNVYCELDDSHRSLRAGMTGFARIEQDQGSLARIVVRKCLSPIRTEFWW